MIILASNSPRRKQLLSKIVPDYKIEVSKVEEVCPSHLKLKKVPVYLATLKASDVYSRFPNDVVIGADTIVISKHQMLGKPKDKKDIYRMINMLQGTSHYVVTGVCIIKDNKKYTFSSITKVYFKKMSKEQIEDYCNLETLYDKAGAYAIQAEAKKYIHHIIGEYHNVMGLPICKLKKVLRKIV